MTLYMLRDFFMWCSVINLGLFFLSFLFFRFAHDFIFRYHGKWYKLPEEKFNAIYYSVMIFFKTAIILFNLVPFMALSIII